MGNEVLYIQQPRAGVVERLSMGTSSLISRIQDNPANYSAGEAGRHELVKNEIFIVFDHQRE